MHEPLSGEMNSWITLEKKKAQPSDKSGFSSNVTDSYQTWAKIESVGSMIFWKSSQTEHAVTHRIFVRAVQGKTYPEDLFGVYAVKGDGLTYKVRRVATVNGSHRFTVLDVEARGTL